MTEPIVPTPRQREAIEAEPGPVLVLAGPGAGKTLCLIERVRHLVQRHGIAPGRICAVTFTNKAAEEIANRLRDALGAAAGEVTRSTLHALCVGLLRQHGALVDLAAGFGIADDEYQRDVLRRLRVSDKHANWLLTRFGVHRFRQVELQPNDLETFRRYREHLARRGLVDFDDLVMKTAELLERHPVVAQEIAGRWDAVLVDEFQDLNPVQYAIVKRLARDHRNLFVVGDDEQSIYSWAGADLRLLLAVLNDFNIRGREIVLDENRRCSRQIFETARRLLEANPPLFLKQLRADRESPFPVVARGFADEEAETDWLLTDLGRDRERSGLPWGEFALLYRKHETGYPLEAALIRAGIPCRLAQGRAIADDPVVRYVIAALKVIAAPDDPIPEEGFARVVLPGTLYQRLRTEAEREQLDFRRWLVQSARKESHSEADRRKLWRCFYALKNLPALAHRHASLSALVEELLSQRVGEYRSLLEEHQEELSDPEADGRVRALADRLAGALYGGARVWIPRMGGLEIALTGLLLGAGVTMVDYLGQDLRPGPGDLELGPGDGGALGLALGAFKALQLATSRTLRDAFRDFVAFDLETTDQDYIRCEIVELGAVRVRNGEPVADFHTLVRPRGPVSPKAREVHGYGDEDLRDAPTFEEVWPRFRAFVGEDVLVAHNGIRFDFPVIRRQAKGMPGADGLVTFDTLPLARALHPGSRKLGDLAHAFGIEAGRSHHALDDARTLAGVFRRLEQEKLARARKTALANLLDYLGMALALSDPDTLSEEGRLLFPYTRAYALGRYSDCLQFYRTERERPGGGAATTLEEVIERLGGEAKMQKLRAEKRADQRYPAAMARLRRLLPAEGEGALPEQIGRFLERVALSTRSEGPEPDHDRVNLLTLHSTKGLEFSRVYIVGVEDAQLLGKDQTGPDVEEARRVLYVGMTRAKERLVLTRADRRGGNPGGGSRFLEEMGLVAEPLAAALR